MEAHLLQVHRDIEAAIPDANFDGLAVLDFESWRPLWFLNWGSKRIYKNESIAYVLQRFPHLSRKSAKSIAAIEFNVAAADFLRQTIRYGLSMRPFAKWGFYGIPYCNYDAGQLSETECSEDFKNYNDRFDENLIEL
ncbi:unnamed protein product [Gongylonema pulchrum]|uniref:Hyaluronidase n=1 Tax=Gongylonema pulchrum TaxID=637853 RepID=A0A183DIQ7_9BILA|nr:unnamed protein product [Gongylonema pulchrum]